MTNKELIELYHTCDARKDCNGCPHEHDERCAIDDVNPDTLVQRLEALLAENRGLEAQCEAHCETERKLAAKISKERRNRQKLTIEKMKLKAECDHFRDLTKKLWCEKQYGEDTNVPSKWLPASEPPKEYRNEYGELKCFLVCLDNTTEPFRAVYDGKHWGDGWSAVAVTHWMPLPERPSTEGGGVNESPCSL